jgi:DNA-binding NtrC family response regulator
MATKILLVDDEEQLRKIVVKVLARAGYKVDVATNGAEALQKLGEDIFDLLITDIRMPVSDGDAALPKILSLKPHLKVIVLTGYPLTLTPKIQSEILSGHYHYLAKPFDNRRLLSMVQELEGVIP